MAGSRGVIAYRAGGFSWDMVWNHCNSYSKLVILITQLHNNVGSAIRPGLSRATFED
jgi:hypothetical protein